MRLSTPYDLQVPNDAIAQVSTEGLLGPAYIDINVRHSTGPPASDHATLKTGPTVRPLDAVRALVEDIHRKVIEEKTSPPKPPQGRNSQSRPGVQAVNSSTVLSFLPRRPSAAYN